MKKTYKILILLLTAFLISASFNAKASNGYTYDHRGQPIYSTKGLTVNQAPYMADDLGILKESFTSPEDLFIYKDANGNKVIYIVDSVSNRLFVFNEDFVLQETISRFRFDPSNFSDETLSAIKTEKKYVVARDNTFIVLNKEKMNLLFDEVTPENNIVEYTYGLNKPLVGIYRYEWASSKADVLTVEKISDGKLKLTALKAGSADVSGKTYVSIAGEEVLVETVTIKVNTDPATPIVEDNKYFNFPLEELKKVDYVDLRLGGVTAVYRAVNPNTGEDYIYLCDKGNNQVVVLDSLTYEIVQFVTTPDDITFNDKQFSPSKIVTDGAGRMYIIADNVYEGILQFSKEGEFNRFTGVNYVTLTPWEIFWRNFSTEAQLAKQATIINTSFTSMSVDSKGFIYTTSYATTNDDGIVTNDNAMIKKINTAGKDVLRRNGYQAPKGDVNYVRGGIIAAQRGPSKFTGITVNDSGMFTVVDSKMGKLFTYDNDGKLLYISGESLYLGTTKGKQIDVLSAPVAVRYLNDNIVVLDKNNSAILIFEPTDIGKLINEAAMYEYEGDSENAAKTWQKVVEMNANYEYGYIGIGKMHMNSKQYKLAMEYFEKGADRKLYSRAYKLYRDAKIRTYFGPVMGTVIFLIAARYVYKLITRKRNYKREEDTGMGDE